MAPPGSGSAGWGWTTLGERSLRHYACAAPSPRSGPAAEPVVERENGVYRVWVAGNGIVCSGVTQKTDCSQGGMWTANRRQSVQNVECLQERECTEFGLQETV